VTPQQFIAKWQAANLSERSACQQHFLDLCELLSQRSIPSYCTCGSRTTASCSGALLGRFCRIGSGLRGGIEGTGWGG
jgi:hypothetical protein